MINKRKDRSNKLKSVGLMYRKYKDCVHNLKYVRDHLEYFARYYSEFENELMMTISDVDCNIERMEKSVGIFDNMYNKIAPMIERDLTMPSLTDIELSDLAPQDRSYVRGVGHGLKIMVHPTGKKVWKYHFKWKREWTSIAIGIYPEMSRLEAWNKMREIKKGLKNGINPHEEKHVQRKIKEQAEREKWTICNSEYQGMSYDQ